MTECTLVLEGELCDCLTIPSDITAVHGGRAVEMWLEETGFAHLCKNPCEDLSVVSVQT